MIFSWPKLKQSVLTEEIDISSNVIILIEHDIPLLFITKKDDLFFLNYLIDEDENTDTLRYLFIQISNMKLRALVTQGITLYECLKSDNIFIYDTKNLLDIILTFPIKFDQIDIEALPEENEFLPKMNNSVIDEFFGFDTGNLCFILSGEVVENNSISFEKLSKFLHLTQKMTVDVTEYYCDINQIAVNNVNRELKVNAHKAGSFALVSSSDDTVLNAIENIVPKYIKMLTSYSSDEIYKLLDEIPTNFAKNLFAYFNLILSNNFESVTKIKNKSFFLDNEIVKSIKNNVNNANYVRKENLNLTGYLTGANTKTNYFYFVQEKTNETFSGYFSEKFSTNHQTLTVSSTVLVKISLKQSIEYKFSSFKKSYELIDLEEK